jgi:metallo-beta-lactamase family protein
MALRALRVYRRAIADGDPDIRPDIVAHGDPFDMGHVSEVREVEASMELDRLRAPAILISASGMATGGRVLHHLKRYLPDHRASIILVGFQAAGTRGRQLAEGARQIKLLGRYVSVRAEVVDLPSFSVHADADELMSWLASTTRAPDAIYVVHGETESAAALAERATEALTVPVVVPTYGERVRLD